MKATVPSIDIYRNQKTKLRLKGTYLNHAKNSCAKLSAQRDTLRMEEVSLENVVRRCGDFNRYQFIHFILLSILNFSSSITGFYYVFGLAEPHFRCQLPSNVWPNDNAYKSYNMTHSSLLDQFQYLPLKCEDANGTTCSSFVYDRSIFGRTFTEEGGYICSNSLKKTWLSTAHQIGT